MVEFFIAKKQMIERKKQSIVSIVGIAIGIIVLVVSIGVANGLDKNMIDSILSLTSHITVSDGFPIENYKKITQEIDTINGVRGAIPTIETQGILKFGNYVTGVRIEGKDLQKGVEAQSLDKKLIAGKIGNELNGILIGHELQKRMGASVGDMVSIITAENKQIHFKIMGIFQSGYYEYDMNMVIIPLKAAQYITNGKDQVQTIDVILDNPYNAKKISRIITNKTDIYSRTWGEQNRNLLSALALEKTIMILVFSLIVVIAGFVVWVTLNMLVREKIKDIGILRAFGYSRSRIIKIFLLQGLTLGIIGIFIGTAISLTFLYYISHADLAYLRTIYYIKSIPVVISIKEIFIIIFTNIVVIFVSSILPAYRAGKLDTVEALKYE